MPNKNELFWGHCYFDHFAKFFGKPKNITSFSQNSNQPEIHILEYENVFGGCSAFCSLGITHYKQEVKSIGEVFAAVNSGAEYVPELLANVIFYLIQHQMKLGWGTAICGLEKISPIFFKMYEKSAVYLANPFGVPDEFECIKCKQEKGKVLMACFIAQSEFEFFNENGAEVFEELLERKNADMFDLMRAPVC
jgi:hypothetical protein